jgi:protein ImuA
MPALAHLPLGVWHAHALAGASAQVLSCGHAALDAELPGGGWPVGALTEILQPAGLHSEWRLLLPALARSGHGAVVLVGAPQVPFAPALAAQGLAVQRLLWVRVQASAQRLWAAEQALRCADVDAVLLWLPQSVRTDALRRLHVAAAGHSKLLFVMRPGQVRHTASPAVLRLLLTPLATDDRLQVDVPKRRGPLLAQAVQLQARNSALTLLLAASRASLCGEGAEDALDRVALRA